MFEEIRGMVPAGFINQFNARRKNMFHSANLRNAQRGSMLWGFLIVILGLFAMMSPAMSGVAVTLMVATLLIIAGTSGVIFAFSSTSFGEGVLKFVFGGITAAAGVAIFLQPGMALVSLTLFLAIYFVVDGIFHIYAGFQLEDGKGWVIFNGVVTLLLGAMIWKGWPVSGVWAVGILVGFKLVMSGMVMMTLKSTADTVKHALRG